MLGSYCNNVAKKDPWLTSSTSSADDVQVSEAELWRAVKQVPLNVGMWLDNVASLKLGAHRQQDQGNGRPSLGMGPPYYVLGRRRQFMFL